MKNQLQIPRNIGVFILKSLSVLFLASGGMVYGQLSNSMENNLKLAQDFADGVNGRVDYRKAVYHYRAAATQGSAEAQAELAWHYLFGEGVAKSTVDALDLATLAAEQDIAYGHVILGLMYKDGMGVARNADKALDHFVKATELDKEESQAFYLLAHLLEFTFKKMEFAAFHYERAAELEREGLGNGGASYRLGVWYEDGIHYEKSIVKAVAHYEVAVDQGDYRAASPMGYLFAKGIGVEKNPAKAFKIFMKGAENGNADCQYNVGYCYYHGIGVIRSVPLSDKYVKMAARNGHEKAKQLVNNAQRGDGGPQPCPQCKGGKLIPTGNSYINCPSCGGRGVW